MTLDINGKRADQIATTIQEGTAASARAGGQAHDRVGADRLRDQGTRPTSSTLDGLEEGK